jgi:predicted DNA-binding transcriptional regulator AlpA
MSTKLLRFRDLQARGIVKTWPTLKERIKRGFPPGRMIGPNSRAWTEDEIDEYIRACPVEGPAPRGAAKARRGRPRKAAQQPPPKAAAPATAETVDESRASEHPAEGLGGKATTQPPAGATLPLRSGSHPNSIPSLPVMEARDGAA